MGIGRWLLPGLLAVLFVGVAGVDLYRTVRRPAADLPEALPLATARFEPDDYLLDLRHRPPPRTAALEETAGLTLGRGWGQETRHGRWTVADRASLVVNLPVGGQEVLFVDCRPGASPGPPPRLSLTVNQAHVAPVALKRGFGIYRVALPEGTLAAGDNRIELALVRGGGGGATPTDGTLLVRRLAFARAPGTGLADIVRQRGVQLHDSPSRLLIGAPGRLVMRFEVPRAGSTLTVRYRFREPQAGGGCTVTLGRSYAEPDAVDLMAEKSLLPGSRGGGALHLSLGHHTGAAVLWVRADAAAAAAGVVLRQPVLAPAPSR